MHAVMKTPALLHRGLAGFIKAMMAICKNGTTQLSLLGISRGWLSKSTGGIHARSN